MSDTPKTDALINKEEWVENTWRDKFNEAVRLCFVLERENAALRQRLDDAVTSLCTISQQAGRTKELEEMSEIRGYAFSRYSAAIDAARAKESKS